MAETTRPTGPRHTAAVYRRSLSAHLRSIAEYPADFWVMAVAGALGQVLQFAFLTVLFANVTALGGWSYHEMLMLVGFMAMAAGTTATVCDGLWSTGELVVKGELDYRITRPAPVVAQVASLHVGMQGAGEITLGAAMLVFGWIGAGLSPALIPLAVGLFACAVVVQSAIVTILCAMNFWVKGVVSVFAVLVVDLQGNAMRLPLGIFPTLVRAIATFVLPLAFVNFVPVEILTGRASAWWIAATPVVAAATAAAAAAVYRAGLRAYDSSGH